MSACDPIWEDGNPSAGPVDSGFVTVRGPELADTFSFAGADTVTEFELFLEVDSGQALQVHIREGRHGYAAGPGVYKRAGRAWIGLPKPAPFLVESGNGDGAWIGYADDYAYGQTGRRKLLLIQEGAGEYRIRFSYRRPSVPDPDSGRADTARIHLEADAFSRHEPNGPDRGSRVHPFATTEAEAWPAGEDVDRFDFFFSADTQATFEIFSLSAAPDLRWEVSDHEAVLDTGSLSRDRLEQSFTRLFVAGRFYRVRVHSPWENVILPFQGGENAYGFRVR